jgi:photosystem II stability/assembly factor-like uncharacterized protein
MFRSIVSIFLLLAFRSVFPQQWVDMMLDHETNVFDVKAAFDQEWQGRSYERGKGWKQFHRWYWFMEQRTWPSGDRFDPSLLMQAKEHLRSMNTVRNDDRTFSEWTPLGPTSWQSISYNPGNGRVNTIAIHPQDPSIIYAGTPASGLWRSTDGGFTWEPLFTDLPSMGISGIVIHPHSPDTIFIATGDGDGADTYSAGVLRSNDGGETWLSTGLDWSPGLERTTRALRMDPTDPNRMYCAASNGLYHTTDGGDTWTMAAVGSFRDVEFMPGDTNVVYACKTLFYKSVNGQSFSPAGISGLPLSTTVQRMAIAVSPADPLMVYVLCANEEDDSFLGLYRSIDGGNTFELRSNSPNIFSYSSDGTGEGGQAWYDMALAVDPFDPEVVYVGGINVWKSENGGFTWEIRSHWVYPSANGYTHADIHSLDVFNGKLYCGSDGGIFISEDQAASWADMSIGLDITQFYRLGGSEILPDLVLAGAQDNGSNRYFAGDWTHIHGGDGMEAAVDPVDPDILYASSQNGGLMRSDDFGETWNYIADGIDDEGPWVTPFVIDPADPTRLYTGFTEIWAGEFRGDWWYQLSDWGGSEKVRCLAVAPSDGFIIYAGRNDLIKRSDDAGFSWTDIDAGLPNLSPTSFAISHADPAHVWITFSGTSGTQKVYESLNAGVTWINRSAGLPNVPVNTIVVQPGPHHPIYIGTDAGVFYRDDITQEWEIFGTGLPNVIVSELELNMTLGKIRAATYGRGMWEADMYHSLLVNVPASDHPQQLSIIPMAEAGLFTVRAGSPIKNVNVHDALGRSIPMSIRSEDPYLLDLRDRTAGIYLVSVTSAEGTQVRRILR